MSHPTWVRGLKLNLVQVKALRFVAPYVGAWIETKLGAGQSTSFSESHPTWVRGLKLLLGQPKKEIAQSHPTWVRGLKQPLSDSFAHSESRTLRGCVD